MAWGRGGARARDSSGVVTSCSAGDVSAGASRAGVGVGGGTSPAAR